MTTSHAAAARVESLVELGRYADAQPLLAVALAADPDDARLHGLAARARLGVGDARGALQHANELVRLRPEGEWGHRLASIALSRLDAPGEAARAASEAVRLEPLGWQTHQAYALAASELPTRRAEAARAAEDAVALAPGEPGAHFAVGLVAQRHGDRRRAVAAYERTLAIQPDHADALNNLAVVRDRRHLGRAARSYAGSLRADPQSAVTRRNVELLAVRLVRRLYFVSLAAVGVGVVVSGASRGRVGPATLAVAVSTVVVVAGYTAVVLRAMPGGVRRHATGQLVRQPFLIATTLLTTAMLGLALLVCVVPYGYAVGVGLLAPLGVLNLGMAIWSRNRPSVR